MPKHSETESSSQPPAPSRPATPQQGEKTLGKGDEILRRMMGHRAPRLPMVSEPEPGRDEE